MANNTDSESSTNSSDIDESMLPTAQECSKLISEFVELTKTNSALAQSLLQGVNWDLTLSLNNYFAALESGNKAMKRDAKHKEMEAKSNELVENIPPDYEGLTVTTDPPKSFHFVTWNLDGLDDTNLIERTIHVCKIIHEQQLDIVFLQEVTVATFAVLKERLPEYYMCVSASCGYFNVTLLRIFTVYFDSKEVVPFDSSLMVRTLLIVKAHIGTVNLVLINTHLESTAQHAKMRISQMQEAFRTLRGCDKNVSVIFAGDMNIREQEVKLSGGIPAGVGDVWVMCGARKEVEYTWDLRRNTNHTMPSCFQPRLRFDRIYIRPSCKVPLIPTLFTLIGLEKVPNTQSFPSDHWGVLAMFSLKLE